MAGIDKQGTSKEGSPAEGRVSPQPGAYVENIPAIEVCSINCVQKEAKEHKPDGLCRPQHRTTTAITGVTLQAI